MAINGLQIPQIGAITPDITPTLANLVNTINQGQQRQTLADLGLGLANVVAGLAVPDPAAKDRWENVFEWWLGLLMVGWYAVLALGWRRQGLAMELKRHDPL